MDHPFQHHTPGHRSPGAPGATVDPRIRPAAVPAPPTVGQAAQTAARTAGTLRAPALVDAASRWAWLTVLAVGSALFLAVHGAFVVTGNGNFVPTLILLGSLVVPASFVTFVAQRRLPFTFAPARVAVIGTLGGVTGVVAAGLLGHAVAQHLGVLPTVLVAVVEEAAKLLVPLAVLWCTAVRRAPDGLLIGVATGAGFGALETMGYTAVTYVQSPDALAAADGVLLVRGLLSPAGHIAWTGILAATLWGAAHHRWTGAAVGRCAAVLTIVVTLHTAWDDVEGLLPYAAGATVSLALLAYTARRVAPPRPRPTTRPHHISRVLKQQRVVA